MGGALTGSPILAVDDLSKSFGSTRALDGVSLRVEAGEVHALVGQNGSGKSTLIKILSGYHAPDDGAVAVRGEPLRLPQPAAELRRLGVSFMHQDLGLVGTMSLLENLRVGRYETGAGWRIRWRRERARTRVLLRHFGLDRDPRTPVRRLSHTERAILGIVRALQDVEQAGVPGLLVLDEPTASLPEHEVERLFEAVRRVRDDGSSVLFVTHRLEEVFAIGDRVTVLRDGRAVGSEPTAALDERALIRLIVGRDLGELYPELPSPRAAEVLRVRDLRGALVQGVSFSLHEGEILGLTGLVGAGHDEVPYLVCGARPPLGGVVEIDGRVLAHPSPAAAKGAGIAFLPADRQREAGIPNATVRENVTLPFLASYGRAGALDERRERRDVAGVLERLQVHPRSPERRLRELSGGNQQKALLGRWVHMQPRVLLLHEPTQGVDVGSRQAIFRILRDVAAAGTSIVYASAEYEDLANLCERVLVFRRGRMVAELAGEALSHEAIVEACYRTGDGRGG